MEFCIFWFSMVESEDYDHGIFYDWDFHGRFQRFAPWNFVFFGFPWSIPEICTMEFCNLWFSMVESEDYGRGIFYDWDSHGLNGLDHSQKIFFKRGNVENTLNSCEKQSF